MPIVEALKQAWHAADHPTKVSHSIKVYLYKGGLRFVSSWLADSLYWQFTTRQLWAMAALTPGYKAHLPIKVPQGGGKAKSVRFSSMPVSIR